MQTKTLTNCMQAFVFMLFSVLLLDATEPEIYHGFYSYRSDDTSIQFLLSDCGISKVRINSREGLGPFIYSDLGQFGNTALIEIKLNSKASHVIDIKLLIILNRFKVELVTGYYAELQYPGRVKETSFVVTQLKPITMNFVPLADYNEKQQH